MPDLSRLDPGGALARSVGLRATLGGVVTSATATIAPGAVRNDSPGLNALLLGEVDDAPSDRVASLRAALCGAGYASPPVPDIRAAVWGKLMANLSGSTLCLITQQANKVLMTPWINRLARLAHAEALAVAAAHGIVLDDGAQARLRVRMRMRTCVRARARLCAMCAPVCLHAPRL